MAAPPARADIGSVVIARDGTPVHGLRASAGAHWASGTTSRNVPFDIGAGVVYERVAAKQANYGIASVGETVPISLYDQFYGGYLEGAARLTASGKTRSWIGGRAEVMRSLDGQSNSVSVLGRLSWELYGGGTGGGGDASGNGLVFVVGSGTLGIGAYLESGLRHDLSGKNEFLLTGGLSVRIPAFVLVAVGFK